MKNKKQITIIFLFVLIFVTAFCTSCDKINVGDSSNQGGTETGGNQQTDQGGNAERHNFTIAVMSDMHVMASSEIEDPSSEAFKKYNSDHQRMLFLSEAIFNTAVDRVISDKVDVVFLAGDLTENGSKASLQVVADGCEKMKNAGIQVFVTCGINDLANDGVLYKKDGTTEKTAGVTQAEFREMFGRYGYNEAMMSDTDTLSYSCDIQGTNYRLNVVDTASLFDFTQQDRGREVESIYISPVIPDSILDFTEEMMMATEEDKKTPLIMSHYPISDEGEGVGLLTKREKSLALNRRNEFEDIFCEYGTQYIFSGNLHTQSVYTHTNFFGEVTNYITSCLTNYPLPINYYTESDNKFVPSEVRLNAIKEEYLPSYIDEETKQKVTTDLQNFSIEFLRENVLGKIKNLMHLNGVNNGYVKYLMKLTYIYDWEGIDNAKSDALSDDIYQETLKLKDMSIYGKENSIEAICAEYGIQLGKTEYAYTTVYDFVLRSLCDVYAGESRLVKGSVESDVFRYIIYSALKLLADMDIFARLNDISSEVTYVDVHPVVEELFLTGIIDFKKDNFILYLINIINPIVYNLGGFKLDFTSADTLFQVAEAVAPIALAIVGGTAYNPEDNSLWGVVYTDYASLVTGKMNINRLLDDVLLDVLARDILY